MRNWKLSMLYQIDDLCLSRLFPAFIRTDAESRIVAVGPSLRRLLPTLSIGHDLCAHFHLPRGWGANEIPLRAASGDELEISSIDGNVHLRGSILGCGDSFVFALRHVPAQLSIGASGLQMSDFGPDDPTVHGILLIGLQKALIEEAKEAAVSLAKERRRSLDLLHRIGRVAGFFAHDMNNLLSIIRLNAARIPSGLHNEKHLSRMMAIITESAERGAEIARSLMTLAGQRQDSRLPCKIDDLVRDALALFRTVVGSKIEIRMELCVGGEILCNVTRIGLMNSIINILLNARDAMPNGGTIKVSTYLGPIPAENRKTKLNDSGGEYVVILVKDNGYGMPPEVRLRAFEPLFSTKTHGSGIGLASVKDFVDEMGGDIFLESSPEQGTAVYIYLPILERSLNASENSSAAVEIDKYENRDFLGRNILLVEDEPYALEALTEALVHMGAHVTASLNAEEAENALSEKSYDLVLSDILLPDGSGIDVAKFATVRDPSTSIILMSGYIPDDKEIREDWLFLRKPIEISELSKMIASALEEPRCPRD